MIPDAERRPPAAPARGGLPREPERPPAAGPPEYRVCAFGSDDLEQVSFTGGHAFSAANDWYEAAKADPAARQLWLIRYDGRLWQMVDAGVRRDGSPAWEPLHLPAVREESSP